MTEPTTASRPAKHPVRWVGTAVLLVLALLLGVMSILAVFARNQVLNTDRFVSTMSPLASDPVIQDAVAKRLTTEVLARVDLTELATEASTWLQKQGAPPAVNALVTPAVNGVESFISDEISKIVHSDQFQTVWDSALRAGHQAMVNILTGSKVGPVSTSGDTISIDLGQLVAQVKQRLVDKGFGLASKIPAVSIPFTLFESSKLPKIRSYVRILNDVANWLPWVTLAVIVGAVFLAPNRRRGIVAAGLTIALGLLLTRLLVRLFVDYYLGQLPPTVQSPAAVENALTIVLRNVRAAVYFFALIFGLAALFALLAGPSRLATGIRRLVNIALDGIGGALGRSGIPLGPVPEVVARYRRAAAPLAIGIAIVVLVFNPSVGAVWWSVFWVLLSLAIVEILARARPRKVEPVAA